MREIKFRIWVPKHKDMHYEPVNGLTMPINLIFQDYDEGVVFMQYTGMKDKNSKEVYEGDILEIESYDMQSDDEENDGWTKKIKVVEWDDNYCGFKPFCWSCSCEDRFYAYKFRNPLVIGNIYENPELLK